MLSYDLEYGQTSYNPLENLDFAWQIIYSNGVGEERIFSVQYEWRGLKLEESIGRRIYYCSINDVISYTRMYP